MIKRMIAREPLACAALGLSLFMVILCAVLLALLKPV